MERVWLSLSVVGGVSLNKAILVSTDLLGEQGQLLFGLPGPDLEHPVLAELYFELRVFGLPLVDLADQALDGELALLVPLLVDPDLSIGLLGL